MKSLPPTINPYLNREQLKKKEYTLEEYLKGIENGNRVLLSRAITLVESKKESDRAIASQIIQYCLKKKNSSFRIGITGVPGVGKSTFIESFGLLLIEKGHKVAVLAVDPSSEKSGGSILGDKTRMEKLSRHQNAYIRPSPSGGTLGGVAKKTRETILLCELAGFDRILIETVGVGQGEILVHSMVDFFMLLILPGSGDELQGMKRGIMEMADGIVITKADGDNLKKAKIAKSDIQRALHYFPISETGWNPPVILTSALTSLGFSEVYQMLKDFENHTKTHFHPKHKKSFFEIRRDQQSLYWFEQTFIESLKQLLFENLKEKQKEIENKILNQEITPFEASEILMREMISRFQFSDSKS